MRILQNLQPAFDHAFSVDVLSQSCNINHLLVNKIAIDIRELRDIRILIQFQIQFQFVTFLRGHPCTPIDPAPVLLSGKPCSTSQIESSGAKHSPPSLSVMVALRAQI